MKFRPTRLLFTLLLFVLFFAAMAYVQFSTPNLPDNDGFYHIKMAWLMRTQGLKPAFPWLPLTILDPREFYDHHFLFHVALIPFTFGDLVQGAKWAAVTLVSLAFLSVWVLFEGQGVPFAWLWSLGLLGVSEAFLYRMSVTRAESLSLAILVLALSWILDEKYFRLSVLAFLYVWFYDAFPLILALAVLHLVAVALTERRLELHPLTYVCAGLLLGMLINPYFPYNLIFTYRHLLPKLTSATSISVGVEWYPYTTGQLLDNSLPALIAFISGVFALGLAGRKMDLRTTLGLLVSLLFGFMLFQARRFVEYFPAFTLIFAAFAWSQFFQDRGLFRLDRSSFQNALRGLRSWLPVGLLSAVVLIGTFISLQGARKSINDSQPFGLYAGAASWLEHNTPSGARVFQTDWDDFPRLFFYNTNNTYLVGLDPSYMQIADPALYDLWVKITQGRVKNLSEVIPARFGAEYIHTDLNHGGFINAAGQDGGLKEVYRDQQAIIYQVVRP